MVQVMGRAAKDLQARVAKDQVTVAAVTGTAMTLMEAAHPNLAKDLQVRAVKDRQASPAKAQVTVVAVAGTAMTLMEAAHPNLAKDLRARAVKDRQASPAKAPVKVAMATTATAPHPNLAKVPPANHRNLPPNHPRAPPTTVTHPQASLARAHPPKVLGRTMMAIMTKDTIIESWIKKT